MHNDHDYSLVLFWVGEEGVFHGFFGRESQSMVVAQQLVYQVQRFFPEFIFFKSWFIDYSGGYL